MNRRTLYAGLATALSLATAVLLPTPAHAVISQRQYVDSFVSIPSSVLTTIATIFPEASAVGEVYLSPTFDANLTVVERATVAVTFVHEGAGYLNSFGYFTWRLSGGRVEVLDRQLVFPNASYSSPTLGWGGGTLQSGDTVTLRDAAGAVRVFEPGTNIGFFVVSDGWNGSGVTGWNEGAPALPSTSAASNAGIARGVYASIDELNPEQSTGYPDRARHFAVVRMRGTPGFLAGDDYYVVGVEDQRRDRGSDNDFNDVMFFVRSTPETALQGSAVVTYDPSAPDPDGDGVEGLDDAFPNDPDRAFVVRTPASGFQTLAFEDNYPRVGDADYNDVVLQFAFDQVLGASGKLKDLGATFHLVARGAGFDHRFGLALHGVPSSAAGSLRVQHFASSGALSDDAPQRLESLLQVDPSGGHMLRLDGLIASTRAALPAWNTERATQDIEPASMRAVLSFTAPIDPTVLGTAPFDAYLHVVRGGELYDVHRPGFLGFADRPAGLPTETGATSFLDQDGYPFALVVPSDWRYPLESVPIDDRGVLTGAFPTFAAWRQSRGSLSNTWYTAPRTSGGPYVTDPFASAPRTRPWTLQPGS